MPGPFEPLGDRLLRGGVAPAHVRRYLRELSDHLCDLAEEELKAGASPAEAQAAAWARLGGEEALAGAMLAQPSLRSWTSHAPWAMLVVGPFLLLILTWIVAAAGVLLLVGYVAHTNGLPPRPTWTPPEWLPREWEARLGTALLDLAQVGGPLLIGAGIARLAARQRSHPIWPVLGCMVVALLGATLVWRADWPAIDPRAPLHRVSWSLSLGLRGAHRPFLRDAAFSLADWSHGLPLIALSLAVAGAVYWLGRRGRLASA